MYWRPCSIPVKLILVFLDSCCSSALLFSFTITHLLCEHLNRRCFVSLRSPTSYDEFRMVCFSVIGSAGYDLMAARYGPQSQA